MQPTAHILTLDRGPRTACGEAGAAVIRVLLAQSERLMRAGLRALLAGEPDIDVVAEAVTGEEAIALAAHAQPDVVVMASCLRGMAAPELAQRILAQPGLADVRLVVLGACESDEELFAALRSGVVGFVRRDAEPVHLLSAVRAVAAGEAQLPPDVARRLIDELASHPDPQGPAPRQLAELTVREREVLALVAKGLTNHQIAEHLVVSPATAKTHVSRVMIKLGAHDRAKLVTVAYETGLVQPRRAGLHEPGARVSVLALA